LGFQQALEGLREGLAALGYTEGHNLTFHVEDARGEVARLPHLAARLVAAQPDLLFTITTAPAMAAKQATTTPPIVFTSVGDPLRAGLVASYASSQNNLTGVTSSAAPLSGKRLEVLQELAPGTTRVLVLVAAQEPTAQIAFQSLADVAPKLGITLLRQDVTSAEDAAQRLAAVPQGAIDALFHVPQSLLGFHLDLLIHKALADRIPLSVFDVGMVEQGALVSYGADQRLLGRQAAKLVVKILQGVKPAALPIQTPEKVLLAINLTTAKAIGFTIPQSLLERADRLVE
jgi:putative ABC transport system substrate-binding protein